MVRTEPSGADYHGRERHSPLHQFFSGSTTRGQLKACPCALFVHHWMKNGQLVDAQNWQQDQHAAYQMAEEARHGRAVSSQIRASPV
jgi:hypothetical protein